MRARPLHSHTASVRILGWLLVFLLAQTLGWMHRGLHLMPHGQAVPALQTLAAGDDASHPWTERLFAGHTQASDCHLYDTLTHADAAPVAPLALGLAPTWGVGVSAAPVVASGCAAAFSARGPPLSV